MKPRWASSKSARSASGRPLTNASFAARVAGVASFGWATTGCASSANAAAAVMNVDLMT